MGHRVNIMLDEEAWNALQACAKGERSKVVNNAITAWFKTRQRIKAAQKMDALRAKLPGVSTQDVVSWIREDRERMQ
ncbi:MAG: hypothetical protein HYX62_04420 [Gammaproteobacteria bacterium]|jgi:hypothetical protein|nr:hypothetical protein [Gammaproteobacteria bacterium]